MADWFVRVVRYDGSKGSEEKFDDYNKARKVYDKVEKLVDGDRETAGGRIRIQNESGVTFNMDFIV